ncbi:phage tail protein [Stagnimonas aquatica]|uniref:Phage tail protein n=1 Tax=Stagnimonas aquatica TaxID=2689987 RepID=A0A3N0V7G4_9GAMM|nr:phage tail sheath subtilisin-like domain-containing protein [Stagnimonas aquatica]ROH88663.1 phage tail protein [Stagnimonas aquatica]
MSEIQFNSIPVNLNVPGQYAEFDPSRANTGAVTVPQRTLLIGQQLAGATAVAGQPRRVFSPDEVGALCGRGSQIHHMAKRLLAADALTPAYILPLADKAAGTKSSRTLTVTGPSTAAGTVVLYVGERRYAVGVSSGMSAIAVAAAIIAAVNADADRYLDAAVDGADAFKVVLSARHKGIDAGNVRVTLNRYDGETLPLGVGVAIGALTAGTGDPDLTDAIAALGDQWYTTWVLGGTDGANLALVKAELADRFGPLRQLDAYAYAGINLDAAAAITLATGQNSPWLSLVDCADVLTPTWATAAHVAGCDTAEPDPGRPRQTLPLTGVVATAEALGRRTFAQRNQLIEGGVSTLKVDADGTVRIERLTTTYRTNTYGVTDKAYFDTETLHLLANLRYTLRSRFALKYPRHKLGADGSTGPNVMTPAIARAEIVSLYIDTWMEQGWVEGGEALTQFIAELVVERDGTDPNRLNSRLPPDLINQLRVSASQIQFIR